MKRVFCGRFTAVRRPTYRTPARKRLAAKLSPRRVVRGALLVGIVLMLGLSTLFVLQLGESSSAVAYGGASLPADRLRIDAAGAEQILEQSVVDPRLIIGTEMPMIYGIEVHPTDGYGGDRTQADIYFDILPDDIKLEILEFASDAPRAFALKSGGPHILIYHTHTTEAYRQVEGYEYVETGGAWRTEDETHSIVAVGEVLAQELRAYGFGVLHNTTNHEPPKLSTAYARSLQTMEQYAKDYPSLRVFIDVHRDAYGDVAAGSEDFVTINGEECARVMFVVGTGEKFDDKPNYESNYKLALAITNELESICKGFTRPIRVKTSRYNQHISDMCLLIEVGHNANSLEQAKNAAKYVAKAISRVIALN